MELAGKANKVDKIAVHLTLTVPSVLPVMSLVSVASWVKHVTSAEPWQLLNCFTFCPVSIIHMIIVPA